MEMEMEKVSAIQANAHSIKQACVWLCVCFLMQPVLQQESPPTYDAATAPGNSSMEF